MKPFNIFFKKETLKMKKARKQKELVYLNKKNYNSIDSTLKDYNLDKSLFIKPLENSFFKFDDFLNKSQNIVYNFNNKKRLMLSNINSLLQDAFNTMGSLVNKPVLEIGPKKILIYLLFFYKKIKISRYLKNKQKKAKKLLLLKKKIKRNSPLTKTIDSFYKKIKYRFNKKYNKKYNKKKNNFYEENYTILVFLSKIFNKFYKKRLDFDLTRLHSPVNDSLILAKSISILGNKIRRRFKYFVNFSFKSAKINNPNNFNLKKKINKSLKPNGACAITGIKIKLGGRILAQKIVPRFTSQTFQEGSLTRTNADFVTSSIFTNKNRKGTYSISVSIGHKYF